MNIYRGKFSITWRLIKRGANAKTANVVEDNTSLWSGDHIVDPAEIPGVLLMNRPFEKENARQVDIAPTVLKLFDQPSGEGMSGKSLLS